MRILMLSNLYPPNVQGGAEILAGDIAEGLARQGHNVQVLTSISKTPAFASPSHVRRTLRLARPVRLDQSRPRWRQLGLIYQYYRRFHQPTNMRELRRVVAETRPDVLYIWEISGLGIASMLAALHQLSLPIVFHLGSYWLLYARAPVTAQSQVRALRLKRWLIGSLPTLRATSMIAVSAALKNAYVQAGFDPLCIEVIHNGVAARFLQSPPQRGATRLDARSASMHLLFVGRLCPEKGVMTALEAMVLLAPDASELATGEADVHLDIIGDGEVAYLRKLHAFARENGLKDRVTFHGSVPQETLIGFYDRMDVMLNTSLWQEPFGLTTIEAMARGLPIIASQAGGTTEIITHGVNGLLTEPGNAQALASAIRQVVSDLPLRARLAQAAQRTVLERFTIEENVRRVAHHLQLAVRGDSRMITMTATAGAPESDQERPAGVRRTV